MYECEPGRLSTTDVQTSATLVAQGDASSLGCRVYVDDQLRSNASPTTPIKRAPIGSLIDLRQSDRGIQVATAQLILQFRTTTRGSRYALS